MRRMKQICRDVGGVTHLISSIITTPLIRPLKVNTTVYSPFTDYFKLHLTRILSGGVRRLAMMASLVAREWIPCGAENERNSSDTAAKPFSFKIIQWNVLADALSRSSDSENFFKAPPEALSWESRREKLLEEIERSEADIICLEEVDHFDDFFSPKMEEKGFKGFFKPKDFSSCLEVEGNNGPDGCALFYNTKKFSMIEMRDILLPYNDKKEVNHGAIMVKFQRAEKGGEVPPPAKKTKTTQDDEYPLVDESGNKLVVAVTHLKAGREHADKRLMQGKTLFSEVEEFSKGLPTIICGDFNAEPTESIYDYFKKKNNDYFKKTDSWLESAYCKGYDGKEPPFTSWKFRPGKEYKYTIDYIWYTGEGLGLSSVWAVLTEEGIGEKALPALAYPSDHIALCVELTLRNK